MLALAGVELKLIFCLLPQTIVAQLDNIKVP